jgi:hemolysin III
VALGWVCISFFRESLPRLGAFGIVWLLAGGVLYTIGAAVYAIKRPNPVAGIFGYHEVFHAGVVLAAACHYRVVFQIVMEAPAL